MRNKEWLLAGVFATVGLAGCNKDGGTPTQSGGPPALAIRDEAAPAVTPEKPTEIDFNEAFDTAAITDVLDGHHFPPERTFAGKKTGPLRAEIEQLWPSIKLTDAANRPLPQLLKLETGEGRIEITLRPELAPNHVRNLQMLAKSGFYDGLLFERNVHQEADIDGEKSRLDLLIGGCPTGTGDDGYGHLGYFVRSEARDDVKHEAGTVGFWHEEDPDSAGTRFYITLGPAPALDGKFTIVGKVTQGLEVVKRIASFPVKSTDPSSPENEKPVQPTTIKKASIVVLEK